MIATDDEFRALHLAAVVEHLTDLVKPVVAPMDPVDRKIVLDQLPVMVGLEEPDEVPS